MSTSTRQRRQARASLENNSRTIDDDVGRILEPAIIDTEGFDGKHLKALQMKHEQAGIQHEQAERSHSRILNIKDKQQWLNLTQSGDLFGEPIGSDVGSRSEYKSAWIRSRRTYGKDLNQLDQASSQLRGIITNAQKTGKLPGADSVVGLLIAIGISSAPLKGARIPHQQRHRRRTQRREKHSAGCGHQATEDQPEWNWTSRHTPATAGLLSHPGSGAT